MDKTFSSIIREKRVSLREAGDRRFSQRQVAIRIGVEPTYLSQVERGNTAIIGKTKKHLARVKTVLRESAFLSGRDG